MAPRMAHRKVTIRNLEIVSLNINKRTITIKDFIRGENGSIIYIQKK